MYDHSQIRQDIITGLRDYLRNDYADILIISINPDAPEPAKPFMVMNVTSAFVPERGLHAERWVYNPDTGKLDNTMTQNATMSCSFSVYSDAHDEAHDIGLKAISYFEMHGYEYLQSKGVVAAEIRSLQNRDIYQEDRWERRVGFDVIFRMYSAITNEVDRIVTADVTGTVTT